MSTSIPKNCKQASSFRSTSLFDPVIVRMSEGEQEPITVPQLFQEVLTKFADRPALKIQNSDKNWLTQTYQDYWNNTRLIAKGFIKLGLKPRTSCGILAFSSPEWFITQMATIFAGGVSAGIYLTNSAEAVYHVLHTANATICVVDNSAQMAKVRLVRHRLPQLKSVIQIEAPFENFIDSEEGYHSWSNLKKLGASDLKLEDELEERLDSIAANECVALIFTSGTVGMPKGVMLSHDNLITSAKVTIDGFKEVIPGQEVLVSYLPMNHVSGQVLDFFMGLTMGSCVFFADRNALKSTLLETIIEAQPTRFFGVPRVFEKMHDKILAEEQKISWISKLALRTARRRVSNYIFTSMMNENNSLSSLLGYWLGLKVTSKYKTALGLGRCKNFLTGAAPSALELKKFFMSFDIKLSEMYGLSETSGAINICWELEDLQSCGKALPGVELRLANVDERGHGEICTRNRMVYMGYLHEPEKTNETFFEDGWMHTGDIGYFDAKQRLCISGRLKELIVTSGGENIPPIHIEILVKHELPGISNTFLIGDRRKFLTMLVTIKTDIDPKNGKPGDNLQPESIEWMKSLTLSYVKLSQILKAGPCPKVLQSIQEGIDRANAKAISNAQRVQKFSILPHDFSIPTGELGPTLKLRRNIVLEKYADIIDEFYKNT